MAGDTAMGPCCWQNALQSPLSLTRPVLPPGRTSISAISRFWPPRRKTDGRVGACAGSALPEGSMAAGVAQCRRHGWEARAPRNEGGQGRSMIPQTQSGKVAARGNCAAVFRTSPPFPPRLLPFPRSLRQPVEQRSRSCRRLRHRRRLRRRRRPYRPTLSAPRVQTGMLIRGGHPLRACL